MKKLLVIITLLTVPSLAIQAQDKKSAAGPKDRIVEITTDFGTMKIKLYNETPKHRDNFIKLAKQGFYDGTLFHRVIQHFVIQGGDPDSRAAEPNVKYGSGGTGYGNFASPMGIAVVEHSSLSGAAEPQMKHRSNTD